MKWKGLIYDMCARSQFSIMFQTVADYSDQIDATGNNSYAEYLQDLHLLRQT